MALLGTAAECVSPHAPLIQSHHTTSSSAMAVVLPLLSAGQKDLGYSSIEPSFNNDGDGNCNIAPVWISNPECTGSEDRLFDCGRDTPGNSVVGCSLDDVGDPKGGLQYLTACGMPRCQFATGIPTLSTICSVVSLFVYPRVLPRLLSGCQLQEKQSIVLMRQRMMMPTTG
eukprot:scaffold4140_cov149-Amphora_coffeaeformis.AAC.1